MYSQPNLFPRKFGLYLLTSDRNACVHIYSCDYKTDQGYLLEKAMAAHSSTHAWKIPWTEEPGRL